MASRKKAYVPHRGDVPTDAHLYAEFISDLLDGTVKATDVQEKRTGKKLDLDYTDPNG